jgi:two-component system, sensor histidine kinase PdtaS
MINSEATSETERTPGDTQRVALEKVRRHIRILIEVGKIAGDNELANFLDQTVLQVARAVEIDHVKVLQYRRQTADLLVVAGLGWAEGVVGSAALSSDMRSAPGRAFQTGEPITIKNLYHQKEYVPSELLKEHGIVSLTNVPVLIDGAAWGVLEVDSTEERDFSEDTTDFMTAVAALLGAFVGRLSRPDKTAQLIAAVEAQKQEVLLQEMQHRIKNNFQVVLSSISLQKRRNPDAAVHRALDHVASRINAISLAHDQLAHRNDGRIVRLSDYVLALCSSIRQQADGIEINAVCDQLDLSIDRAVPVGLILNEAATNSIKHAFGANGGTINVSLTGGVGYGEARLTVSDNGRGIGTRGKGGGSGIKLIASLARQIGGTVDQESSSQGTTTSLRFPIIT